MTDILIGLIPAFGWGFSSVLIQIFGGRPANKQLGMVLSTLVLAIIVFIIRPPSPGSLTWTLVFAALFNAIPWTIGQVLQIKAFDLVGVSRAIPISTGMQLFGATLVGVVVFHEWTKNWQFAIGIPALGLLIFGVWMTSYREKSAGKFSAAGQGEKGSNLKAGLIVLTISSIAFVMYATTSLVFDIDPFDFLLPQAIVMVLSTLVISVVTAKKGELADRDIGVFGKKTWQNMIAGSCFAAANLAVMISVQRNGAAVGWTLSQMNVIVATLGGLIILKERKTKKELIFVLAGLVLVAVGGILIGVTKT